MSAPLYPTETFDSTIFVFFTCKTVTTQPRLHTLKLWTDIFQSFLSLSPPPSSLTYSRSESSLFLGRSSNRNAVTFPAWLWTHVLLEAKSRSAGASRLRCSCSSEGAYPPLAHSLFSRSHRVDCRSRFEETQKFCLSVEVFRVWEEDCFEDVRAGEAFLFSIPLCICYESPVLSKSNVKPSSWLLFFVCF